MASPDFAVNGGTVNTKIALEPGAAFTALLDDISGVDASTGVAWSLVQFDELGGASDWTSLVVSGSVDQQYDGVAPSIRGRCAIIEVTVAGGQDVNGFAVTTLTRRVKIYTPMLDGGEVLAASSFDDDNRNASLTHGAVTPYNESIRRADQKFEVRLATTAALATHTRSGNVLTITANGALANIDSVTPALGDLILVKDEGATHLENGVYEVTVLGDGSTQATLTRTDVTRQVIASEGTTNQWLTYTLTTPTDISSIVLNTTALGYANVVPASALSTTVAAGTINAQGVTANKVWTSDGSTAGGVLADVLDAHVGSSAAIAGTKIA